MRKLLLALSAALLAVSVSSCSWFQKPEPVVQVRYKSMPFPYMSVAQTKIAIACRVALGGNEKRRKRMGEEAVAKARQQCLENYDVFDSWWAVFVKLSDAYDKLESP